MPRLSLPARPARRIPASRPPSDAVRPASPRRPRSVPYIAAGSVLTLGAVAVLGMTFVKIGGRVPVLVVDQALQVGQVIQAEDLKVVDIAPGTLSQVVSADDEAQVIGQPAALPLAQGEVLTRNLVGAAAYPPPGTGVATAALKSGSYPQNLVPGSRVQVVAPASASGAAAQVVARTGTVTAVSAPNDQGDTVVSILTDEDSARAVGSAPPDTLALVLLPVGS